MSDLDALLAGCVVDPWHEFRWLVLADWLEEHDDPRRAELLRLHRRMLGTCADVHDGDGYIYDPRVRREGIRPACRERDG